MSSVRNLSHQLADVCHQAGDRDKSTRTSAPENCEPTWVRRRCWWARARWALINNHPCVINVATPPGTRSMGTKLYSAPRYDSSEDHDQRPVEGDKRVSW